MNKILLKTAAAVNIAAAAIIYIACSGDDGKDGKDGLGCSASPSVAVTGGIDISCPGSAVVTLPPGTPGGQGPGGGSDGCFLQPAASGFDIICDGQVQGNIPVGPGQAGGCTVQSPSGSAYITFVCPGSEPIRLAKATCTYTPAGGTETSTAYDPDTEICTSGAGGGVNGNCDDIRFVRGEQFCAKLTATAAKRSVLARCGAVPDTIPGHFISEGTYDPTISFCQDTVGGTLLGVNQVVGTLTTNIVNGGVRALCGTTANASTDRAGWYTTNDFCYPTTGGASANVYARCGNAALTTYNPTTQFCQFSGSPNDLPPIGTVASAGSPTNAVIKSLCGTVNAGTGRFGSDVFCTNQRTFPICTGANSPSNPVGGTPIYPVGEYDIAKEYCYLNVVSAGTSTEKRIKTLGPCPTTATTSTVVNGSTSQCVGSTIYPLCEGKIPVALAAGATLNASTQYNVAKQFCDTRGSGIVNPSFPASAGEVTATGGKLYSYETLGGKVWMAEDLGATASNTISSPQIVVNEVNNLTKSKFTWAEATDTKNICPEGWHLSTEAEWVLLAQNSGQQAGLNLRSGASVASWSNNSTSADSVFAAKPATIASSGIAADEVKLRVFSGALATDPARNPSAATNKFNVWWTEVQLDTNNAYVRSIQEAKMTVERDTFNKLMNQFSIRCVKD